MSIETRIQAINDHLIDDYKVLRLAGADLTGVNKNIVNLKMSWKERLLYFMNNGTDEVWNNWDKVSGTGTTLSLNNTEEAPMSLVYKGNTSQSGTPTPSSPIPVQVVSGDNSIEVCGKNLVNINDNYIKRENATYSNITVSNNTLSFEITGSRSGYVGYIVPTIIGQTYTLSFNLAKGFIYTIELDNVISDISGNFGLERTTPYTYTATKQYLGVWLSGGNTTDNQASVSNLMLEKGNQATTYEAFKGASYPISLGDKELCKIGTYQDKIDKSTGSNMFDKNAVTDSAWLLENGTLSTGHSGYYVSDFMPVTPNTAYYKYYSASARNKYYDKNKQPLNTTTYQDIPIAGNAGTFTTPDNCYYVRMTFLPSALTTLDSFMVNEGTTALPYEPYGTGWYLKKEIGKYTFTGNENWTTSSYGTNSWAVSAINTKYDVNKKQVMCEVFNGIPASERNEGTNTIYSTNDTIITIRNTALTTLSEVQSATSGKLLYYALATPTYETITDTTLIGQLEALKKSYESVTNISQVNNDLPFELSVTALEVMS